MRIKVDTGRGKRTIELNYRYTRFLPPTEAQAMRELAEARAAIHEDSPTSRPLSEDYELIGVVGEWVYEAITGYPMDRTIKKQGDGRVDFLTGAGGVDVKTAALAYNLLREVRKEHAQILVLAQFYAEPLGATLLGWEYNAAMLAEPAKEFGHGILNYYKKAAELNKMKDHYFDIGVLDRVRGRLGPGRCQVWEE